MVLLVPYRLSIRRSGPDAIAVAARVAGQAAFWFRKAGCSRWRYVAARHVCDGNISPDACAGATDRNADPISRSCRFARLGPPYYTDRNAA